jgi:LuxR family quorum-sensing system transcriptional regulator CciR
MDVVRTLSFDTFACGEVDIDNRDRTAFYIVEWPEAWRKFYIQSGLINRDPLIDALRTRRMPFTWSELRRDRKLARAGQAALTLAAEQGWTEGLVVSVPRGGSRYGLTSLVGRCGPLSDDQRDILSVCCICLLSHVRTIAPRSGFAMSPAGLSPRELASVQLVAKGMVDQEIADALGISRATAHQHVEGAKRKMAVKSRAELVALAVSLGFIAG